MRKSRKRRHDIHLRLNDEEYKTLEMNRAKCGRTQQTYLRMLIKEIRPRELLPMDFLEVLKHLRNIDVNILKIAVNAERGSMDKAAYLAEYWHLQKVISELRQSMYETAKERESKN